jgi:molecular chaperone DnaK (HSP70)
MAGKTPTELNDLITEVREQVAVLDTRVGLMKDEIDRADFAGIRQRLAVIEHRVAELTKAREDGDRWFKQLLLIVIGAALTLLANVLVNVVLFARK